MKKNLSEKIASSSRNDDIKKYLKAAIAGGILAAGTGAAIRMSNAKKERRNAMNPDMASNVITVPVDIDSFLGGIPTPKQHAEMYGGKLLAEHSDGVKDDDNALAVKDGSARPSKIDFFSRKKASSDDDKAVSDEGDHEEDGDENEDGKDKGNEDGDSTEMRDGLGRFTSPTDPVAVNDEEKTAESLVTMLSNPSRTFSKMFDSATRKPIMWSAGALTAIYITSKIVDEVNRMRREKSEKKLSDARNEYVKLLEKDGAEKEAFSFGDLTYGTSAVLGGSLIIPALFSAIIVNKIMANRKKDEKRKAEMASTIPKEPIILYKTVGGDTMELSPKQALASIVVKEAMIEHEERINSEIMEKKAFLPFALAPMAIPATVGAGVLGLGYLGSKALGYNGASMDDTVNKAIDEMARPENNEAMLNLTKSYMNGDEKGISSSIDAIKGNMGIWDRAKTLWKTPGSRIGSSEFRNRLMSNGRFQDMLVNKFKNDKAFSAYGDKIIGDYLGKTFKKGGFIHNLLQMIIKLTGYGPTMIKNFMGSNLSSNQNQNGK